MDSMKKGSKEMQEKILLLQKERDQVIQCTCRSFHLNLCRGFDIGRFFAGVLVFVLSFFIFLFLKQADKQTDKMN